jgi:hypothetical protein
MSASKFASITSSLLARKGEAKPWEEPDAKAMAWRAATNLNANSNSNANNNWRPPEQLFTAIGQMPISQPPELTDPAAELLVKKATGEKRKAVAQKRCSVRMSFAEYEQLGIMAVKKGSNRQLLLQDALSKLLAEMAREYGGCAWFSHNTSAAGSF